MPTLGTMKTRIANDLARSNLTSEIADSIDTAIAEYEMERFWFNESRSITFSTVASQEWYTSSDNSNIPDLLQIDFVKLTDGTTNYGLKHVPYKELELISDANNSDAQPIWYTMYAQQMRMYPVPDTAYTITVSAHIKLGTPSDDASSNAWTTEAEMLIRSAAKRLLYEDVIHDDAKAARHARQEHRALERLRAETTRRVGTGRIQPTEF